MASVGRDRREARPSVGAARGEVDHGMGAIGRAGSADKSDVEADGDESENEASTQELDADGARMTGY